MDNKEDSGYYLGTRAVDTLPQVPAVVLPDEWGPVPEGLTRTQCAGLLHRVAQAYVVAGRCGDFPEDPGSALAGAKLLVIPPWLMPLIADWWDMRANQPRVAQLNRDYARAAWDLETWGLRVRHFRGSWWRRMLWTVLLWGLEEQEGR